MVPNAGLFLLAKTIARGEYPPRAIPSSLNSKMHQDKAQ